MAGEILRPPRLTGNAEADLSGVVEFLWALYRALVLELQFVRSDDLTITDEQLLAIAALDPDATNNLPYFTAVDSASLTPLSAFGMSLIDDGSAAAARGTLGLGALAVLDTVGAGVLTDDSVTYAKIQEVPQDRILGRQTASTGNIEEITCTSAGRALIDDASAAAQRTTLGLGSLATLNAANVVVVADAAADTTCWIAMVGSQTGDLAVFTDAGITYNASTNTLGNDGAVAISATSKMYLDGVAGTGDTYIYESSADVLDFYAGGANTLRLSATVATVTGDLSATGNATLGNANTDAHVVNGTLKLQAYTVATLPAAGTAGRIAYVTDALAPAFLTAVVGGGAIVTPVFDNGVNWVAH